MLLTSADRPSCSNFTVRVVVFDVVKIELDNQVLAVLHSLDANDTTVVTNFIPFLAVNLILTVTVKYEKYFTESLHCVLELCLGVTHCTIKYALLRLKAYGAVLGRLEQQRESA